MNENSATWSKMHAYCQRQGHTPAKRKGRDRENLTFGLQKHNLKLPALFLASFYPPEDSYEASPGSKETEKHSHGQGTRCLIPNAIPVEGKRTTSADEAFNLASLVAQQ